VSLTGCQQQWLNDAQINSAGEKFKQITTTKESVTVNNGARA